MKIGFCMFLHEQYSISEVLCGKLTVAQLSRTSHLMKYEKSSWFWQKIVNPCSKPEISTPYLLPVFSQILFNFIITVGAYWPKSSFSFTFCAPFLFCAFEQLRKTTLIFVMSVCPSVLSPHGTTRLPLGAFS